MRPSVILSAALLLFHTAIALAQSAEPAGDPALLNVRDLAPGIVVDMRYATADNFTKRKLYPVAECLLNEPAARRLAAVQKNLEREGLGLKVWDCYRPISIQKELWKIVPDDRYVANPKTGSRHNRGASVDLTLVDRKGNELPMPTGFDDFSKKAHRGYQELPAEALRNRARLQAAMESEGWVGLPTEWWHFDDPEWSRFSLRDEPLGSASLREDKPVESAPDIAALLDRSGQLIVVISDEWKSPTATLRRFDRTGGGWSAAGAEWPVSLGLKGMSWGAGLVEFHGEGPQKQEGDNTAPAGLFKLGTAFGYAETAPANVSWPYQPVSESWVCVDDPRSENYNLIFDAAGVRKDWSSAERMRRKDHLYTWGINVEQNFPTVRPGCGSCIFLHIWRAPHAGTEGCTAMEEENLLTLLRWLRPEATPLLLQLPRTVYEQNKKSWQLP